jgi:hypothetical protein
MRVLYWVNVDGVVLSSGLNPTLTITPNQYNASTIGIASATYGVLNIQNSGAPLTGALGNSVLSAGLAGSLGSVSGAANNSGVGDSTMDIGPVLGQRVFPSFPPGPGWVSFAVAGGVNSAFLDGGTAIIGTSSEGGAGNVGVVSSTFDWAGSAGVAGSSTKIYYNPAQYWDEYTGNTSSKTIGITFGPANSNLVVGMGPFNNSSGFPGSTASAGISPIHSTAELYMDPTYDSATLFGSYFGLSGVNNSPLKGPPSTTSVTRALGIDGLSGLRDTADANGSLFGGVTISIPVPEPGALVLCSFGCVAVLGYSRRR